MKTNFLIVIFLLFITGTLSSHKNQTETKQEKNHNAFLVKTQLTKEQLQALLKEGEVQLVNLKKKKEKKENVTEPAEPEAVVNKTTVEEADNTTNDEGLFDKIEDAIMDDALLPLNEFHVKDVKNSETKTLIVKTDAKFMDSLYEKKFGKIYGYLTLFFFFFVLIYFNGLNKNKNFENKNIKYVNYYEFDSSKDYLLA